MSGFVSDLIRDFGAASALEKTGFVLSVAGLSTLVGALIARVRLRNTRAQIDNMRKDAVALAAERDRAESQLAAERAHAESWIPDRWIEQAQKERRQGNEDLAIGVLEDGFERIRPGLARTSLALAGHHLSLIVGADPFGKFRQAEQLAQLAYLLDPQDPDAAFLLEDIELIRAEGELENMPILDSAFIPTDFSVIMEVVAALSQSAGRYFGKGAFRIALRLYRRALLILRRGGLQRERASQQVHYKVAQCLLLCGLYQEALQEITTLLAQSAEARALDDSELLDAHILHANVVHHLREHQKAVEIAQAAIATLGPRLGMETPSVLVARAQAASFLSLVERPQEALDILEELLPAVIRVFGNDHINAHALQYHQAFALGHVEKNQEALEKVTDLLQRQVHILGEEHPNVLLSRKLRAELLFSLGEDQRALNEIDGLLPAIERVQGAEHPNISNALEIRAAVLRKMERN